MVANQIYSKIPFIVENQNLIHKIGFTTTTIKKRIASAKTDPTFLLAEVEVVDSYKLFNIKSSKFENLIQKILLIFLNGLAKTKN